MAKTTNKGAEVFRFVITNIATRRKIRYGAIVFERLDDFVKFSGYTAKATTYMHSHPARDGDLGVIIFLQHEITPRVIYHEALHAAYSMAMFLKSIAKKPTSHRIFEENIAEFLEVIIGQLMEYVWTWQKKQQLLKDKQVKIQR